MNIYVCTVKILLSLVLIDWDVVTGTGTNSTNSTSGDHRYRPRKRIKTRIRHKYRSDPPDSSRDLTGLITWKVAVLSGSIYGGRGYVRRRRYRDNEAPGFCHNFYKRDENDTVYGVFTCPLLQQPDNYDWCCGEQERQSCCSFLQDPGRKAGVFIGIILAIFVVIVIVLAICLWITGWTRKELGKRIRSTAHRCYRRARVAGGYKPTEDTFNIEYENERRQTQLEPRDPTTTGDWDNRISDARGKQDDSIDLDKTIQNPSGENSHISSDYNTTLVSNQDHDAGDGPFSFPVLSSSSTDYGMSSGSIATESIKENDLGDGDSPIVKRHPPVKRMASDLSKSARFNPSAEITSSYVPPAYDIATDADFGSLTNDVDKEAEVEPVTFYDPELANRSVSGIETTV